MILRTCRKSLLILVLALSVILAQDLNDVPASKKEDKSNAEEAPEIVTAPPHLTEHDSLDPYDMLDDGEDGRGDFAAPPPENVVRFEASDAVTPTPPPLPEPPTDDDALAAPDLKKDVNVEEEEEKKEEEPEEDEETKRARELFETANGLLNASSSSNRKKAWDVMVQSADLGNTQAKVKLAWAKLAGVHFPQDPEEAKAIFEAVAEKGNPEAQMGLGFLYATGTLVDSSQAKALLYYTFGAFGGSAWAQMALGYRYWSGMGVATSCEKALDYYRRVAQSVAEEVSFSGGQTVQRIRLQDEIESGSYSSGKKTK